MLIYYSYIGLSSTWNNRKEREKMTEIDKKTKLLNEEKEQRQQMYNEIARKHHNLFMTFPKLNNYFYTNRRPISDKQFKYSDLVEYNGYINYLAHNIEPRKIDGFIELFLKFQKVQNKIKETIDNVGGFYLGHSYIIVASNSRIMYDTLTWALLSFLYEIEGGFISIMKINTFDFLNYVELLQIDRRKKYDNDYDSPFDFFGCDTCCEVIEHKTGYMFNEQEKEKVYGIVNNRIIQTNSSKRKAIVILTENPIPIFEQQILNGVKNLQILDLRGIEPKPRPTVEME